MVSVQLSIIIVNWNSTDFVLACLRSIREQTSAVRYEVIVVDNASFDGCGERLAREHPDVRFIQSERNLGFGRANNLGAEHARGNVFLFLNPDTKVLDSAIDRLYAHLQGLPRAGVVGCRLLNTDGSVQTSCVQAFPTILNQVLDADLLRRWFPRSALWGNSVLFDKTSSAATEVEAVSGACMLVRRELFEGVGGFSTDYFMYGEDLDLCYRVRSAGFRNLHVPNVNIIHHGGGSADQKRSDFSVVMMRESVTKLIRKSHGRSAAVGYRLTAVLAAVIRLCICLGLFPAYAVRRRVGRWIDTSGKWIAVLTWGIGLGAWMRQYDLPAPASCLDDGNSSCAVSAEN